MAEHSTLTGASLHEPKGVAAASASTVYIADGAGSGTWTNPYASVNNANKIYLFGQIDDISTAGSVFIPCPLAGDVNKIWVTLQGAITVADAIVTAEIAGVAITGLSVTVAYTGSAGGSTFSDTPTGGNTLTAGQALEIITDGGSTTAMAAIVCVEVDVS